LLISAGVDVVTLSGRLRHVDKNITLNIATSSKVRKPWLPIAWMIFTPKRHDFLSIVPKQSQIRILSIKKP